jgi:hypothetical protein
LQAEGANEFAKAEGIKAEFKTKFGIPLTVTERNRKEFAVMQSQPRPERMLKRIAPDVRPLYEQEILKQQQLAQMAGLTGGMTQVPPAAEPQ